MQGVIDNQIQGLSRIFIHRFKDVQGLGNQKKIQGLSRTGTRPVYCWQFLLAAIIHTVYDRTATMALVPSG